jgi:hydrogenase maturation protease
MRVLVAGVGNLLRGDDGFGVVVAERLLAEPVPDGVRVIEVGIGGIHLVQELFDPVQALVVVDAVDLGRAPGTVVVLRPDVVDVAKMSPTERHDALADMHYATPERAFMLARALGVLPEETRVVGGQAAEAARLGPGLSPMLEAAVDVAAAEVRALVSELGVAWVR